MDDPAQLPKPGDQATPPPAPPKDMSAYIRTYAKDVAELTNQPPPPIPPPAPVPPPPAPVLTPPAPPPPAPEIPVLKKEDSQGIFAKPETPVPPPAIDEDEVRRREEVLARLRAKVGNMPPPAVAPPVPPPAPPPPPSPPAPVAPPPPPGVVPVEKEPSPLHTYTSDFADRIDKERANTFTVLAAQQDEGVKTVAAPKKRSALVSVALAVILIVMGVAGMVAAYRYFVGPNNSELALGVPSLVLADERMELPGPNFRQDLADASGQPLVEGNILITYVTQASSTDKGSFLRSPQPGGILIRNLKLTAPDILLRNVDLSSTVGIIAAGGQTHPFFILRVSSYERTFAGMLAWEATMLDDLAPLYPLYVDEIPAPLVTGTSTPLLPQLPPQTAPQGFTDAIVANRDVRILRDAAGRSLLLYGYDSKDTLIVARDEAAFAALAARLAATRAE